MLFLFVILWQFLQLYTNPYCNLFAEPAVSQRQLSQEKESGLEEFLSQQSLEKIDQLEEGEKNRTESKITTDHSDSAPLEYMDVSSVEMEWVDHEVEKNSEDQTLSYDFSRSDNWNCFSQMVKDEEVNDEDTIFPCREIDSNNATFAIPNESVDENVSQPAPDKKSLSPELALYYELEVSQEKKKLINQLLNTMAKNNVFKLLFEKKRLKEIGKKILDVHPVRFLSIIFTDNRLIECLVKIRENSFKWEGFTKGDKDIPGLFIRMEREADRDNLTRYIPGFSEEVQVDNQKIISYIQNRKFEGLIKYLLEQKR
ncbi:MAG: hypothetical protein L0207_01335 [Chlamydiae bacterium]|nr:hypothetical protein [Chlamydiota bacterium]